MGSNSSSQYGSRTTSEEVSEGVDLTGKVIIVTGANNGIGLGTARTLALRKATLVLACRTEAKGKKAEADLRAETGNQNIYYLQLDLASPDSIKRFVEAFRKQLPANEESKDGWPRLDALVENAGIFMPNRVLNEVSGLEQTFHTNHLGHFALAKLLLPALQATPNAKLIVVSSESHRQTGDFRLDQIQSNYEHSYSMMQSYGQSKLCNVLFVKEFHRRHGDSVTSFSLHPGAFIATGIADGAWYAKLAMQLARPFTKSITQGAATTVRAVVDDSLKPHSGSYMKDCNIYQESTAAQSEDNAKKLWEYSEELFAKWFV